MSKNSKKFDSQLNKNSTFIILLVGFFGVLSLLFTAGCLYLIYETAYTTYLNCSKNDYMCVVKKKNILGEETVQYEFYERDLADIKLDKKKNILGEEAYYLILKNQKNKDEEYLITSQTSTKEEQQVYLDKINEYLSFYRDAIELKNPRYKLKFIGLAAAGAGGLVALFLFLDCINGVIRFRKEQKEKRYGDITRPGGYF